MRRRPAALSGRRGRLGSEIDQGIIGDRRAARGMARTLSSIMNVIGGAGFIEAFTGQDIWGCPLDGWSRGMSFFNGFGIAGMMGEAEEGGSLAGGEAKSVEGELHHIATNKNFIRGGQWSKRMTQVFEKHGVDLNKARENLVRLVGHRGPHSDAYDEWVYEAIKNTSTADELFAKLAQMEEMLLRCPEMTNVGWSGPFPPI